MIAATPSAPRAAYRPVLFFFFGASGSTGSGCGSGMISARSISFETISAEARSVMMSRSMMRSRSSVAR